MGLSLLKILRGGRDKASRTSVGFVHLLMRTEVFAMSPVSECGLSRKMRLYIKCGRAKG